MIVAIDTNVIVAALSVLHPRHESAARAVEKLVAEDRLIVPVHALMEAYSVMTRLPRPFRTSPTKALRALRESLANMPITALPTDLVWPLLQRVANHGISGGRIYDAVIAHAAREASAEAILTFNARHFEGEGLEVLTP